MWNSRSIPSEIWEQARRALVFYFSRRFGILQAEDLAHETLMAIWIRDDFEFEEKEQFLRVCYGFAARIAWTAHRRSKKGKADLPLSPAIPGPENNVYGMSGIESKTFAGEVIELTQTVLTEKERALVELLISEDRSDLPERFAACSKGNLRVQLFRVRRKIARLVGVKPPFSGPKAL